MIGRPFKKGQSGNPGGRPKVVAEIRQLARERGPEAIAALVKVMTKGKSEAARVAAANALLDRGWGRPKQSDESEVTHRYVVELPPVLSRAEWQEKYGRSRRAYRGIGADPVTVIWPGSNPARGRCCRCYRLRRGRLDVWHAERSDEAPAPEHGATDMRLDDHFGSGSTLQRNERVKLAASFWNNVGAGMVIVGMAGAFFLDKPPGAWAKIGIAIGGLVLGWFCYSIASNILTYLHTLPEERR